MLTPVYSRERGFDLMRTRWFPAYSPAGDQLAVTMGEGIQIMNPDGSNFHKIYGEKNQEYTVCAWSPRGDQIALTVGRLFAPREVRSQLVTQMTLIKPDGTGFHMVTSPDTNGAFPSWSPREFQHLYHQTGRDRSAPSDEFRG